MLNNQSLSQAEFYAKSYILWQGGNRRKPGSIHRYVTRFPERSQRSHRTQDEALRKIMRSVARRQSKETGEHTPVCDPVS